MRPGRFDVRRRDVVRLGALAAVSVALASRAGRTQAQAAPRLDETDSAAQALGYRHDAIRVDGKKFSRYQAGQTCLNCRLFQGKAVDQWAPCPIYGGRQVNAKGWCNAYVKRS